MYKSLPARQESYDSAWVSAWDELEQKITFDLESQKFETKKHKVIQLLLDIQHAVFKLITEISSWR